MVCPGVGGKVDLPPAMFGNFGGHFGVLRLGSDSGFLIKLMPYVWNTKPAKRVVRGTGVEKIKVAHNVLKHILVYNFSNQMNFFQNG